LLKEHSMPAEMIPDAHLAALALEHGLVVCSSDLGFGRFPGVRWENPLA
jgi:predicted nucleic acid-binding protein